MKVLIYTDVHLHKFKDFSYLLKTGYTNRIDLALKSVRFALDYAVAHNIKKVFNLGDLYEYPKPINTLSSNLLVDIFTDPKYKDLEQYYLIGNHDVLNINLNIYSVKKFKGIFTKIVDYKNSTDVNLFEGTPYKWVGMPFYETDAEITKYLSKIKDKENTVLFGHNAIDGVKFSEDYKPKLVTKAEYFSQFKMCIFGDIHLRNVVNNKLIYPGGLLTHSFSDNEGGKGFMVYDVSNNDYEFIANPHSPNLALAKINSIEDLELITSNLGDNDFYRLMIPSNEIHKYDDILKDYSNLMVSPIPVVHEVNVRMDVNRMDTEEDIITQCLEREEVPRKNNLLKYGKLLLAGAKKMESKNV